jgi:hypothetical protein
MSVFLYYIFHEKWSIKDYKHKRNKSHIHTYKHMHIHIHTHAYVSVFYRHGHRGIPLRW